jgi:hypothetical protein
MAEPLMSQSDYLEYRGKCREFSEVLAAENPGFRVVRGWYRCPIWGKQAHWWCVDGNDVIHDPTVKQFPSKGLGEYIEFEGFIECANCGTQTTEEDCTTYGNYAFCSGQCLTKYIL